MAPARAQGWSDEEVLSRWRRLFHGGVLVERFLQRQVVTTRAERDKVAELAAQWRGRLADISWLMCCLNESIAPQANQEDGCKGRFQEPGLIGQEASTVPRLIPNC